MSLHSGDLTDQQDLIEARGDGNVLRQFLEIHPPDNASRTPPILAFRRKREVEIPWGEIISDESVANPGAASIAAIREYFEASWGFHLKDKDEGWWKASGLLGMGGPESWSFKVTQNKPPVWRMEKGVPQQIPEGFVLRHGTTGRLYLLISLDKPLETADFLSFASYDNAWKNKIDGVELVFLTSGEAQSSCMEFAEIDLRPAFIKRRYEELCILKNFATAVKTNVEGATKDMIDRLIKTTFDPDEIEELQRKLLRLNVSEFDVQRQIERLVSDAARLGYVLVMQDTTISFKDRPTPLILKAGNLYEAYRRTASWTEYVSRTVVTHSWFFGIPIRRNVSVPCPKEQVVEDYRVVETSKDILADTRREMIKAGLQVYVFEQTPSGLCTTEGVPLRQIMERCKIDESFRRACVVMLPVYEESLTGERLVSKYVIYKRPLPGMVPTILPRLSLEESLTYRTAWVETQLGELLNSINLAPDEEREITITKRFEQETTVTRTSTSIFDITRAESTDLATEMENQTRQERESSKSMQFSTKASGGWGPFSAEASASGGTSSSLKDMSQAISKVATKAAKSVNSQNREEVSTTSTARTTITHTDETVATIHNINQGRALNLMFYRLYNKYEGGLFLEGLRFDVIPSVEVIAGSGVYESRSYSLEELPRMIEEFTTAQLPFAIKDEKKYTNRLLESIETLLRREYATDSEEDIKKVRTLGTREAVTADVPAQPRARVTSVERLTLPPPEELRIGPPTGRAGAGTRSAKLRAAAQQTNEAVLTDTDSKVAELSEMLKRTVIHSNEAIAPQELLVAAPGLYLDAVVGTQPSTEPYSERMREQEVRMRAAEVSVKQSESDYQRALALQLTKGLPNGDGNCLTGLLPGTGQRSLTLSLMKPLDSGDWRLQVDGQEKGKVELTDDCRHIVAFAWPIPQTWIKTDGLQSRIGLVDKNSGNTITFGGYHKDNRN